MSNLPIITHIDRASFSFWSKQEINRISVKKLTEPKSFKQGGALHPEGLYSLALGPVKKFDICITCDNNQFNCPGHYGHIDLAVPVYHPMLVQVMYQIINKCCLSCYHFRLGQSKLRLFLAQLEALNCGFDHLIDELNDIAVDICRDENDEDEYVATTLGKKLVARIKEEKEKTPEFDCHKRPQQRSIVERLSKLFRNFINGQLIKPMKICGNCGEKKTSISLHQSSVLVVGVNSGKTLNESNDTKGKGSSKKKVKGIETTREKDYNVKDLYYLKNDERKFMTPTGARHIFRQIWRQERRTMQRIFHFLNIDTLVMEKMDKSDDVDVKDEFKPTDLFFIDTILVPPAKFRPPMSQRGYSFEGPRTAALSAVMKQSCVVQEQLEKLFNEDDKSELAVIQVKLQATWKELQKAVNNLYDNEMDRYSKKEYPGLKQLIDKKEGLFRKNMMGKRVNFAARSVISPDPNILVDQIGVPLVFAKKLTYPQPVTPWNLEQLREAVLNGPNVYPGAVSVVFDDGLTVNLTKETTRQQVAARLSYHPRMIGKRITTHKSTIVNRHLLTGDVLLFNRQPTLHKPSIMAFRARVLPNEKGFRLHYANCKSFNADFDGDEMNAHLPQSELARSEAYNIASVNYQYLVPKDGSPLGGLIQDHVVAVCLLTSRNQFFDKDRYNQLVYCSLEFLGRPLKLEKPAILRPCPLWTGKQVITTIIKNCIPPGRLAPTLDIKSKIGPKILNISPEYVDLSDCHVIIRNGELLVGFMDKSNVGATQYGLVHSCYELYGGETSSNLMSAFARLATWHLQLYEGFTLGIGDIIVEDDADADRQASIACSRVVGSDSAKEALGLDKCAGDDITEEILEDKLREAHSDRDPLPMKKLDAAMKTRTDKIASEISSRCLPEGLIRRFPINNLQMMIQSGAKGGTVNALQISCLLGQIELEGRRVPLSMSGRSLPSFKPYDTSPKAGGFVSGRFLTGIQPQEFFFHCMAGREGLIDTAVKTSRSGYLQRCLIKHLEGLTVHYDQTVRDSCGSVIQFLYGEDGLDIVKCQMLKPKAFPSLVANKKIIGPSEGEMAKLNKAKESYEEDVIARISEIQEWLENNGENRVRKIRGSGFLDFLACKLKEVKEEAAKVKEEEDSSITLMVGEEVKEKGEVDDKPKSLASFQQSFLSSSQKVQSSSSQRQHSTQLIGSQHHDAVFEAWYALSFKEKKKWNKHWQSCPDPLISIMNPASHLGVVPEKLDELIEAFVRKNPHLIEDHEFYNLCYNLYMKMLAQPGEAVGLLAAQSIGEPSTQMTLNTFHFAGRGEMNVTLGIPRLREILMTASAKIGTPSMDLPLLKDLRDELGNELDEAGIEEQAKRVKLALNAVRLSDVLEYVDVTEQVIKHSFGAPQPVQGKKRSRQQAAEVRVETDKSVRYELTFALLPRKYYKHEFKSNSATIMKFIEEVFVDQLSEAMVKRIKRLIKADELFDLGVKKMREDRPGGGGGGSGGDGGGGGTNGEDVEEKELDDYNAKAAAKEKVKDENESSSDDEGDAEGDNTTQRLRSRRDQDQDYEEPEDDDLEVDGGDARAAEDEEGDKEVVADDDADDGDGKPASDGLEAAASEEEDLIREEEEDVAIVKSATLLPQSLELDLDLDDSQLAAPSKKMKRSKEESDGGGLDEEIVKRRIQQVKMKPFVLDYTFDSKRERWCKLTICLDLTTTRLDMGALLLSEAKRTYIHRVGNIQRALIVKDVNSKCGKIIKTEGVSLLSLVRFSHILDLNAIYSNDIHAIANTYGIEAASQAIRREMANVFAVYGIEVDSRHLSLIADYMTYNGTIRGMNRMSMEASASPFQQMSYESTIRYLKWAAIMGLYDDIKSPSAALVFGRPARGGTGSFAIVDDSESQSPVWMPPPPPKPGSVEMFRRKHLERATHNKSIMKSCSSHAPAPAQVKEEEEEEEQW